MFHYYRTRAEAAQQKVADTKAEVIEKKGREALEDKTSTVKPVQREKGAKPKDQFGF